MISPLPISKEHFENMNNAASHRGPDGYGLFFDGNVALGHRRLAIIDLTPTGHQPMQKQGLCITYNGEIYNYKELRRELETHGHSFQSESDTEVILTAYLQWGSSCVQKFNGMWAFAIFNPKDRILFCSRDRFGVKPFYYYHNSQKFIFSSEIRQILQDPSVPREMNKSIVSAYLVSSVVDHTNDTFFKGIHKLAAGHQMFINTKTLQVKIEKYYDVSSKNTSYDANDFPELMKDAVRLRLRSDTPVGSSLSGGIDSSLIVSLASRMTQHYRFQTFTAVPHDGLYDESDYVRKLEKDLPINAHYTKPSPEDFAAELKTVVETQEEPFLSPSIFMQYFVMKKAHENGLKVLLDGQGADEIFLGYEKYFPAMIKNVAKKNPRKAIGTLTALLNNNKNVSFGFLGRVYLKSQWPKQLSPQARAFQKMLQPDFAEDRTFVEMNRSSQSIDAYRIQDILMYNLPGLLRYEDKNSMHFGIETRLPFLDYRVVDVALRWPIHQLIEKGLAKAPLRSLFPESLPDYISQRKTKFNFNAPESFLLDKLFDCHSTEKMSLILRKPKNRSQLPPLQKWKILNFLLWQKSFF